MEIGRISLEAAGVDLGEAYEALIDRFADRLMRPGDVVVDGGANTGRHTIAFARRVAPDGLVHAFEPLADLVEANRAWACIDGVEDRVRYHATGLSDVAGQAPFLRNLDKPAFSSLRFDVPGDRTERVRVPLETLDGLFPDGRVDFVKMDTAGAEYAAFLGGERLIARNRPFMVFENALAWAGTCFGYSADDFFALFARLHLDLFDAFGRPFTLASWDDHDAGWYFYAVPPARISHEAFQECALEFWRARLAAIAATIATPARDRLVSVAIKPPPMVAAPDTPIGDVPLPAPILPAHLLSRTRLLPTREHILLELEKGGVFCEVGVALGDFSARVLALCDVSRFIAIDLFTLECHPTMWGGRIGEVLGSSSHLEYYSTRFRHFISSGKMQILKGNSTESINIIQDNSVDVFYIDASHDYYSVNKDLRVAARKIKDKGIIILDDYIMQDYLTGTTYGVVRAVNEFMVEQNWEMIYFSLHTGMFCNVAIRRL